MKNVFLLAVISITSVEAGVIALDSLYTTSPSDRDRMEISDGRPTTSDSVNPEEMLLAWDPNTWEMPVSPYPPFNGFGVVESYGTAPNPPNYFPSVPQYNLPSDTQGFYNQDYGWIESPGVNVVSPNGSVRYRK